MAAIAGEGTPRMFTDCFVGGATAAVSFDLGALLASGKCDRGSAIGTRPR